MMRMNVTGILLCCMLLQNAVWAQSKDWNKAQKNTFWEAESFYLHGDYATALKLFEELKKETKSFDELDFYLGHSYFQIGELDRAKEYLQTGVSFNADAYYYLAKLYLVQENFQEGTANLELFEQKRSVEKSAIEEELIKVLEKNFDTAQEYLMYPDIVNIVNLGNAINTEEEEYVPLITADENTLIFTARRAHEKNQMDPTKRPYEDIYVSEKSEGAFQPSTLLEGAVNTPMNDASVGLSADGNRLFLFRTNSNLIGGDLYESLKINDVWTTPLILPEQINGMTSIERSASLSLDGRTLYFSSNREGGFGGFDLYKVEQLPTGKWSLAVNLGPTINTAGDEDSPYIHPNGTSLYFSSTRHENMGGYDVFLSEKEGAKWTAPKNMGSPTNTTGDDIHFIISANEQHGYYASDKKGGFGKHDIYMIDYLEKELRQSVVQAYVMSELTQESIAADISVLDLEYDEVEGVYLSHPKTGKFIYLVNPNVTYELLIEAEGYESLIVEEEFSVKELMKEQNRTYLLQKTEIE